MNEPARDRATRSLSLVGCGILRKEVDHLLAKNGWRVETRYLVSSLHNYLGRLQNELTAALDDEVARGRRPVVVYGACHPRMDQMLSARCVCRTDGQNCVALLLGPDRFHAELSNGAYFLLEDWAMTWEPMITAAFGKNIEVTREIFRGSHTHMLAVRTPVSGDFEEAARFAARFVDLPLRWIDASLDHLEAMLTEAIVKSGERAA